jgi:hypothetical protein
LKIKEILNKFNEDGQLVFCMSNKWTLYFYWHFSCITLCAKMHRAHWKMILESFSTWKMISVLDLTVTSFHSSADAPLALQSRKVYKTWSVEGAANHPMLV